MFDSKSVCRSELATGSSASETASPEASAAETASETSASEPAMERSCHGRETAKAGAVVERFVMGTGYGMPAFRAAVIDRVMFYALEPVNPDLGIRTVHGAMSASGTCVPFAVGINGNQEPTRDNGQGKPHQAISLCAGRLSRPVVEQTVVTMDYTTDGRHCLQHGGIPVSCFQVRHHSPVFYPAADGIGQRALQPFSGQYLVTAVLCGKQDDETRVLPVAHPSLLPSVMAKS